MGKNILVGAYYRLSREDGDNLESESISNQRDFVKNFIDNYDDLIYVNEYVDDGATGGNFNRIGWKQLMRDVDNGKINTIITKDLSRMGRDYISMGDYIERIFPEKRIRYIAINDDIDTDYETPGRDYLQFKLMFNDYYIKDTSKKIRNIMKNKKSQGQYTGWKGIYGYKRDPNDNHKLIIDENVKDIVIKMFDLAKQGYGPRGIADILTMEGIPNPSTYANLIRENKTKTSKMWCSKTVNDLLQNPTYIGNLTQGIRKKVSYKSKKEVRVPKEDWIIVKNTHEAIIDEETFKTVQELLKKNKNNPLNKNNNLLKGFLKCRECGHSIGINYSADKKRRYCACCYYTAHSKFNVCTPHSMNYDKLEKLILDELRNLIAQYIDRNKLLNKINASSLKNDYKEKLSKEIYNMNLKINQINNNIDNSYVDKLNGDITKEQYQRVLLKFKEELQVLSKKKEIKEKELDNISINETKEKQEEIIRVMEDILLLKKPSRDLLVNLIDKIYVSEDKIIEINYKFNI